MSGKEEPVAVNIRQSDKKEYYDRLLDESDSPFHGMDNKYLFLMAMATGYLNSKKMSLKGEKLSYVRLQYFSDSEKAIMGAIAIEDTGHLETLSDKRLVYSIVEEYAAAGIRILKSQVLGGEFGTYPKKLEVQLRTALKKSATQKETER